MLKVLTGTPQPFAWSYSRLHGYEDCPRRYNETQVKKAWPEKRSAQLDWGDQAHQAIAAALRGTPLPRKFIGLQKWVDKVLAIEGEKLIEDDCRWACTRDFKPAAWLAKDVWLRCIADVTIFNPTHPVAVVFDWKAGKSANVDPLQLTLTSLMLLIQFPELRAIRSIFAWLQEDYQTEQSLYRTDAANQWALLMPRVERFQQAVMHNNFPPQPGRFCRNWCPVKSCEHHGK